MTGLTLRQAEILGFIRSFRDERGYSPSVREIGERFGIRSSNGVADHLYALERKGAIRTTLGIARSIVPLEGPAR